MFNVDASAFPTIKANFYALDATGNQIINLTPSDFEVKENGQARTITDVICSSPRIPEVLSSVLVIDISGSMQGFGLDMAKSAAIEWINMLPDNNSECAITSFSDNNYINQDFTKDKPNLIAVINNLTTFGGTNYNAAMIDHVGGGLLIAKTGKHKRVVVFLSDGDPTSEPKTAEIISEAKANNIAIYCVTLNMPAPQCMKDFASQTGGMYFENIKTKEEAEQCYRVILKTAQVESPCQIVWKSGVSCKTGLTNLNFKLIPLNLTAFNYYQPPVNSIANLEINPASVKFLNAIPGIKKDATITVKAINSDFNITNIISTSPSFTIAPSSFILENGQSTNLIVSYVPADSGYTYCKFTLENNQCPTYFYASGGFPGIKPKIQTLKLLQPNGGEVLAVGSDTLISWEGVLPEEDVRLEYSTNNGADWILLSKSSKGLNYLWRVPKTPSNQCLARITANSPYIPPCPDVAIGNQTWMGCNLNVDTYRNGDPIPEVKDPTEWKNLKTGAWCYYNNDPAMGDVYGKLYNWYALNDSRGLAPDGYHLASDEEWSKLENFLGGLVVAGAKMKSTGTSLWNSPNTGATNSSGLSILPGGFRYNDGRFSGVRNDADLWTATSSSEPYGWQRYLTCSSAYGYRVYGFKEYGFSVRCIVD